MIIEQLLGEVSRATFMEEHFLKLPFSRPGGARDWIRPGSAAMVEQLLGSPEADVLVVKRGQRAGGSGAPTAEEARRLHESGHTLLIRHAERHDPRLARLAEAFAHDFSAPVDVHVYWTPPEEFGFGWHYDAEDVFILQTEGSKEYSLRKNTVNPWPVDETLPPDMRYEREIMPMMKCLLQAGDWLYIPNGYWHAAKAVAPSISLAVGLMTPSAISIYDALRERVLESMRWRQRLPVTGEASPLSREELIAQYRRLLDELADDLAATLRSEPFLRSVLSARGIDLDAESQGERPA